MVVPATPANVLIYIFSHLTINLEKQLEQTEQSVFRWNTHVFSYEMTEIAELNHVPK